MTQKLTTIDGQPSWTIRNTCMQLSLTKLGGHLGAVSFHRNGNHRAEPYYTAPWATEKQRIDEPVLIPLRGDFFCLPFGDNATLVDGEKHVCHGDPATRTWTLKSLRQSGDDATLIATIRSKKLPGRITKTLHLPVNENNIYSSHHLDGFDCTTSIGHHATLAMPQTPGALKVSTSKFALGMTATERTDDPAAGSYQAFAPGETFTSLKKIPLNFKHKPFGDCTAFPTRPGFDDLLGVFKTPTSTPAWTAAVNSEAGSLWFSLKDAAVLPGTVFWMANGGIHSAPFSGRTRCLGLEDICGCFAQGLAESRRKNAVNRAGFPTTVTLTPDAPTTINYIQGVIKVPFTFGRVTKASFAPSAVTFTGQSGKTITVRVNWEFLTTGEL
jgi:hypothetical protein